MQRFLKTLSFAAAVIVLAGCAKTPEPSPAQTSAPPVPTVAPTLVPDTSADEAAIKRLIVQAMRHGSPPAGCTYIFDSPRGVARCTISPAGNGTRIFITRKYPWGWEIQNFRPALRSCEADGYHFSSDFQDRLRRAGIPIVQTASDTCAAPGGLPPGDTGFPSDVYVLRRTEHAGDARTAVRAGDAYALVQAQYEDGADLFLYRRDSEGWHKRAQLAVSAGPAERVDARVLMSRYKVPKGDACVIAPAPAVRLTGRDAC